MVGLFPLDKISEAAILNFGKQPSYQSFRLHRVFRNVNGSRVVNYLVISDTSQILHQLRWHFSHSKTKVLNDSQTVSQEKDSIIFVRHVRQFVIEMLCQNLNWLKIELEEAVEFININVIVSANSCFRNTMVVKSLHTNFSTPCKCFETSLEWHKVFCHV